jgi:hypothetical protein
LSKSALFKQNWLGTTGKLLPISGYLHHNHQSVQSEQSMIRSHPSSTTTVSYFLRLRIVESSNCSHLHHNLFHNSLYLAMSTINTNELPVDRSSMFGTSFCWCYYRRFCFQYLYIHCVVSKAFCKS